jgi:catechol 2,3-dioxygenase-like lactoylglutathione lyase family enzyme
LTCGIDHSAISVADTQSSVRFYEALGFRVTARSFNHGIEQERLDGIANPRVEVTALAPRCATPHIELLCYQTAGLRQRLDVHNGDVAASRLVLDTDPVGSATSAAAPGPASSEDMFIVDPDGHRLQLTPGAPGHRERS